MAIYRADRATVAAREESTFGTAAAGTSYSWVGGLIGEATFTPPTVEWRKYPAVGTDRHYAVVAEGKHEMADITLPVVLQRSDIIQYLFEGKKTLTDIPVASSYTHLLGPIGDEHGQTGGTGAKGDLATSLTLDDNVPSLRSFTTEVSYPDPDPATSQHFVRKYTGCKINEATFTIDSSGELLADLNLMAAGVSTGITRSTPDAARTAPYLFYQGTLNFFGTVTEDTSGADQGRITYSSNTQYNRINEMRLTINNNLKNMYYLSTKSGAIGGKYALDIIPGMREISLECSVVLDDQTTGLIAAGAFDNATIWKRLEDEGSGQNTLAPFHTELRFVRTTNTDEIAFQLFDCWITRAPHNIPEAKQEIPVDISIEARKCRIEVINTTTEANFNLGTAG